MIRVLVLITFIFGLIVSVSGFPNGAVASIIAGVLATVIVLALEKVFKEKEEREFIIQIFLGGLLVRLLLGFIIYIYGLEKYFGPDAFTYNTLGIALSECWWNNTVCPSLDNDSWGLLIFVGGVYSLIGANPLAIQFISSICGALTIVLVYVLTQQIYLNKRVARYSAFLIAFFPAIFIWSSQMLKDGFILFLIILVVYAVILLKKHFSYLNVLFLLVSLLSILTLRYYIFYLLVVSAVGGLFLGTNLSISSLMKRSAIFLIVGAAFLFLGVRQISDRQLDLVSLERLQKVRTYGSDSRIANSSIENDVDVSTTAGAISTVPIGIVTILWAPFPWQMRSVTQILIFPEMLVWWAMFPFMFIGIKYTIRHRLRESLTFILFSLMLLLAYSVYQGNIGTIYRQRTQIQIFLLVFVAVGYVVKKEAVENRNEQRRLSLKRYIKG